MLKTLSSVLPEEARLGMHIIVRDAATSITVANSLKAVLLHDGPCITFFSCAFGYG